MNPAHVQADLTLSCGSRSVRVCAEGQRLRVRFEGRPGAWRPWKTWRRLRRSGAVSNAHRVLAAAGLTASIQAGRLPTVEIGHGVKPGLLLGLLGVRADATPTA
jgi:hypothetical protein